MSRQDLFCFSAGAEGWRLLTQEELAVDTQLGDTTNLGPIAATRISIGSLGHLGSDGTLWVRLWDNSPPIDVTPHVQGADAYTFSEPGFATYHPYIQLTTATTNADLETSCWYVNEPGGHVLVWLGLTLDNGQYLSIAANGDFTAYRPNVNQPDPNGPFHAGIVGSIFPTLELASNVMNFTVTINSKYPGSFGLTQLVNMYSQTVVIPPDVLQGATTWGNFNLDNTAAEPGEYYDGPNDKSLACSIYDAPGQPLIFTMGSYNGHFQDYVRFILSGGIPVTIGCINWNWAATCFDDQASWWTITSDGEDGPHLYDDDSFLVWQNEGVSLRAKSPTEFAG